MVKFVSGDLFTYPGLDAIAHGCNCAGVMGAGIAKEFKKRYPENFEYYRNACANNSFFIGSVRIFRNSDKYIINLGTQDRFINPAKLEHIELALNNMIYIVSGIPENVKTIGLPRIGAGLGGLDWEDVKQVILELDTKDLELIVFEEWK